MSMQWTKEPPTKPGFYYWQGGRLSGSEVAVVQVTAFRDRTIPLEACELRGADDFANAPAKGAAAAWGGRWAGPLPQPYGERADP
jgi:hypothetical protein